MPIDDELEESDDESPAILNTNPCLNSFIQYRNDNMIQLTPRLYKQVLKEGYGTKVSTEEYKIKYEYELYLENSEDPFDSNKLTKKFGVIDEKTGLGTLPGLHLAIESMEYKEISYFWISHELMYGALGMVPKIAPKADIVARLHVSKLFDKFDNEIKPQPNVFLTTIRDVNRLHYKAKVDYKAKKIQAAIMTYNKTAQMLENLRLPNAEQELEVKELLITTYSNLAICYNKVNNPQKSCLAIQELERLTSINHNSKALYTKGKALLMLNDLKNAEKFLLKASKIAPDNESIGRCLNDLEDMRKNQIEYISLVKQFNADAKVFDYLSTISCADSGNNNNNGKGWCP